MITEHISQRAKLREAAKAWVAAIALIVVAVIPQITDATAQLIITAIGVATGTAGVYRVTNQTPEQE